MKIFLTIYVGIAYGGIVSNFSLNVAESKEKAEEHGKDKLSDKFEGWKNIHSIKTYDLTAILLAIVDKYRGRLEP